MKYRVDLSAHVSIVVEANDEYEAGNIAQTKVNKSPLLFDSYFEVDDGGVEEIDSE